MATDFRIALFHRPGTLAAASGALADAGVAIEGQCAYVSGGQGVYHVLVSDAERARRALIDAGFEIQEERRVAVVPVGEGPRGASTLLRRIADAGVSIDLAYLTVDGRLVLGGDDHDAIARALG